MTVLGVIFLSGILTRAAEPELRLSPKAIREEVQAVVQSQLAALRTGNFEAAYDFAATGIRRQFDAGLFALLIKRGYPALLRQQTVDLGLVHDNGAGVAQVVVTVADALKRITVYRYWLLKEKGGWRISGVVLEQKPPRGDT